MTNILSNSAGRLDALVLMRLYRILTNKSRERLFYEALVKELEKNPQINALFPNDKVDKHYVSDGMRNTMKHPDLFVTQIRYFILYNFFRKNFPDMIDPKTRILDVGDPDGILFEAMNRKGTSLNINGACVEHIRSKGMEAILGDAQDINLEDKSFDYVFSFQCFEHLPNPIKALNEFARLARKKVFISIPYVDKTIIYDIKYWADLRKKFWQDDSENGVDCHIFEFSTQDFKNLLSHTNLRYEANWPIKYFCEDSPAGRLLNGYFRSYFNFFILYP